MKIRGISLVIATAVFFMASLPALCAALCTFGACPELTNAVAAPKSCCPMESSKPDKTAPNCIAEMNKEAPLVAKVDAPALTFDSLTLFIPLFIAAIVESIRLPAPHGFPAPQDHSPPEEALGIRSSRAPPCLA